jgi:hypothetical protein
MPPKPKVIERGDLGLGITYEVRPAAKGSPTVHVVIDGQRLPPFRQKADSSVEVQVRAMPSVQTKLAPQPSAADEGTPRERSRSPIFNGSSLLREGAALRKDLARKATQPLLVAQHPGAAYVVLRYFKSLPPHLARQYPFSHLEGVWARRDEQVNARPAYTFAYSWARGQLRPGVAPGVLVTEDGGRRADIVLWFSPTAVRIGHDSGEALPGWIIGESGRLGEGHASHGLQPHYLINTDPSPVAELIRRERRVKVSVQEDGYRVPGSGWWTRRFLTDVGSATDVDIWFEPLDVPPNVTLFKLEGQIVEHPTNGPRRRFEDHRCDRVVALACNTREKRPEKCHFADSTGSRRVMTRCNEVESACYWRRRHCKACGACGPIDGAPPDAKRDEVELDACSKGCGAHFCVNHDIDFHGCRQLMECPHLEYDHVALQVSNFNIASNRLLCRCDCCMRRTRKIHECSVCGEMPCICDGHSGWKAMYGELHELLTTHTADEL